MARYNTASLVAMLRERTGLEREALLVLSDLDDSSLRRIEEEKQHPKQETLEILMQTINLPLKGFVYPLLSNRTMADSILCDQLDQALDRGDIASAEEYVGRLEALNGFDAGVYKQYKLSKKAHLWEMLGKPPEMIFPLIEEGLNETFKDFSDDKISRTILVLEEPDLLHTKARLFIKTGEKGRGLYASFSEADVVKAKKEAQREAQRLSQLPVDTKAKKNPLPTSPERSSL